jgi:hypothetical protein
VPPTPRRRKYDLISVTVSKIRSCLCHGVENTIVLCSTGFHFMQACRLLQNLCVLPSEVILHILSQRGHVAKPMCFIEPNRGSAASPKDARRLSKASLPLENEGFARHNGGRRPLENEGFFRKPCVFTGMNPSRILRFLEATRPSKGGAHLLAKQLNHDLAR